MVGYLTIFIRLSNRMTFIKLYSQCSLKIAAIETLWTYFFLHFTRSFIELNLARSRMYAIFRVSTFPSATGNAMVDRDKERFTGTREYIWCHRHRRRRRAMVGQVHREPESVSRSIWDKVRRFCAPRFAETLRVTARTESALHFHFARSASVHSQIVTLIPRYTAALLEREKRAPAKLRFCYPPRMYVNFVAERNGRANSGLAMLRANSEIGNSVVILLCTLYIDSQTYCKAITAPLCALDYFYFLMRRL